MNLLMQLSRSGWKMRAAREMTATFMIWLCTLWEGQGSTVDASVKPGEYSRCICETNVLVLEKLSPYNMWSILYFQLSLSSLFQGSSSSSEDADNKIEAPSASQGSNEETDRVVRGLEVKLVLKRVNHVSTWTFLC